MTDVPGMALGGPGSVGLVADHLRLVRSFHDTIVDRHAEMVHQVILVVSEHPDTLPQGFEAGTSWSRWNLFLGNDQKNRIQLFVPLNRVSGDEPYGIEPFLFQK